LLLFDVCKFVRQTCRAKSFKNFADDKGAKFSGTIEMQS